VPRAPLGPESGGRVSVTRRLRRAWSNDHVHVALWFAIAALALVAYFAAHYELRDRYLQTPAVEQAIAAAVHAYHVAENAETGRLELTFEGTPLGLHAGANAPFGSRRSPAVRGLLAEAESRLDAYDRRLEAALRDWLAGFAPVEGRPGWLEAPLQRFAGPQIEAQSGEVVRIHTGSLRPLVELTANEAGARRLLALLMRAEVYDLRIVASARGSLGEPRRLDDRTLLPAVRESLAQIQRETVARRIQLGSRRLDEPTPVALVGSVCQELVALRDPIDVFFGSAVPGFTICETAEEAARAVVGDPFHARLASLLRAEVEFFWTFGPWRWLELVLLTWLGVLTQCTARLGLRYVGRGPDQRRWDPRESGRTLLELAYAPAVSMVVVWTLLVSGWADPEARVAGGGVALFVPLAFFLGLFPDLGFGLLDRVVGAVFREAPAPQLTPQAPHSVTLLRERGTLPVPAGSAPDFGAVREQARRHASAPLRTAGPGR